MNKSQKLLSFSVCLWKRSIHTASICFKGHSHWQNTRHIKAENDYLRSLKISQHVKLIRLAYLEGGSVADPTKNLILKRAVDIAAKQDVPRLTIQTALKKLTANKDAAQRHVFECRLFGKVLVLVAVNSDNFILTRNEIANAFRKSKAEMSKNVRRSFTERGIFNVTLKPDIDVTNIEEICLNIAEECGAEDMEVENASERQVTFFCEPTEFVKVKHKLSTTGHTIEFADCVFSPNTALVPLLQQEIIEFDKFKNRVALIEGLEAIYDNVDE